MDIIQNLTIEYNYYTHADPRLRDLPLLSRPDHLTIITLAWLYFVLRAGPRYMSDKKPYQIKNLLQCINVVQILSNVFVVYEMLGAGWLNGYKIIGCQPCDYSQNPSALRMARATYLYFLLKLFDLTDTIIFVLRRKDNQVTFLHVYHHIITLAMSWFICMYSAGGVATMIEVINSGVHSIMYLYYFLAALGPQYQRYLWWKKHLTTIQMLQFVVLFVRAVTIAVIQKDCQINRLFLYAFLPFVVSIFYLFAQFYKQSYSKDKQATSNAQIKKKS